MDTTRDWNNAVKRVKEIGQLTLSQVLPVIATSQKVSKKEEKTNKVAFSQANKTDTPSTTPTTTKYKDSISPFTSDSSEDSVFEPKPRKNRTLSQKSAYEEAQTQFSQSQGASQTKFHHPSFLIFIKVC